jgi:hypothetical protein
MKKLLVLLFCFGTLLATAMPAAASITQEWIIDDGNAQTLFFSSGIPNLEFGVYDLSLDLINNPPSLPSSDIVALADNSAPNASFKYDGSNNIVVVSGKSTGATLNIGPSGIFGFYFYDGNTGSFLGYDFEERPTNSGIWYFDADDLIGVTGMNIDVKPIPIPGAALLLGTGLIGLVGFRRRTN